MCLVHCVIGWSDFNLFAILEIGNIAANQVYFKSSIPKNQQVLLYVHATHNAKFSFFFFPTDLNNEYLFLKVCKNLPFTSRRVTKKNSKLKCFD